MRARLLALVCLSSVVFAAQSQPPTPTPLKSNQIPKAQPDTQGTKPDEDKNPIQQPNDVTVSVNVSTGDAQTSRPNQEATGEDTNTAINRRLLWITGFIALFTGGLLLVGYFQWKTYKATLATNKDIERAYVTMSHHPPGVYIDIAVTSGVDGHDRATVTMNIQVRNAGNTPGVITHVLVQPYIANANRLPTNPESAYRAEDYEHPLFYSLVKGDTFTLRRTFESIDAAYISNRDAGWNLWIIGYVDYIDKFNRHHRSGYARRYDQATDDSFTREREKNDPSVVEKDWWKNRSNLLFVMQSNYNYDRERQNGDGKDWGEPEK